VVVDALTLGAVVVAWFLCAPMSSRVVTTQYVIQLVPYVKGQVLKVHAQANQPPRLSRMTPRSWSLPMSPSCAS
jgi:hypothetical protein